MQKTPPVKEAFFCFQPLYYAHAPVYGPDSFVAIRFIRMAIYAGR